MDLSEAPVARQRQQGVEDQSLLLAGVEYSCQERESIDHPGVPFV